MTAKDKDVKDEDQSSKTSNATATTGVDPNKETPLGIAGDVAAGAVQVTEDKDGEAYVRTETTGRLRPENMPTQAQVQVLQAATPVGGYNKEEGIDSVSVDSQGVSHVWPMLAITHVSVGDSTYGPGQAFSVGTVEERDDLIQKGAAVDRVLKESQDPRPGDPSRFLGATFKPSV